MPSAILATAVGVGRFAFGAVAYAAPQLLAERAGLPGAANPDARYMTRLFGARDLLVGAFTIIPQTQVAATRLGVTFDVFDTVSGVLAGLEGVPQERARRFAVIAGVFAVAGAIAAAQNR